MSNERQKIPPLRYDTRRINEDIPIQNVIAMYAGINADGGRGKNIHCPSPNHTDKKPSAHIYGNNCKCFSCGGNFNPISLAKEYYPNLPFPELCQKLLEDNGRNIYDYSNLREIEAIKQAKAENKYIDYFPVTESEMNFIGLENPQNRAIELTYFVKVEDYCKERFGEIPPNVHTHDENGQPLMYKCNREEAVEMGILEDNKKQHDYVPYPTLQQLWQDDKKGIEEMLISKCFETVDKLSTALEETKQDINDYRNSHSADDIREADKLRKAYISYLADGKPVKLTPEQEKKIYDLYDFENNKDCLPELQHDIEYAQNILNKIREHQAERAEHEPVNKHRKDKNDLSLGA
jgi:hypothetical protein